MCLTWQTKFEPNETGNKILKILAHSRIFERRTFSCHNYDFCKNLVFDLTHSKFRFKYIKVFPVNLQKAVLEVLGNDTIIVSQLWSKFLRFLPVFQDVIFGESGLRGFSKIHLKTCNTIELNSMFC